VTRRAGSGALLESFEAVRPLYTLDDGYHLPAHDYHLINGRIAAEWEVPIIASAYAHLLSKDLEALRGVLADNGQFLEITGGYL